MLPTEEAVDALPTGQLNVLAEPPQAMVPAVLSPPPAACICDNCRALMSESELMAVSDR